MSLLKIAYEYLAACNMNVSKEFFEKRMKSHPGYPALASFTDTLDELELEEGYAALKTDASHIPQLSFPFLAQTPLAVGGFEIVPSLDYYEKNKESFLNRWEGVVLMVAPSQKVNNKTNREYLIKEKKQSKIYTAVIISGILLLSGLQLVHFNTISFFFSLSCMVGTGICSLIIIYKSGRENRLTRQLCSRDKDHGCDLVLNSRASKIGEAFHLGDAGLVYFTGLLLFTVITTLSGQIFAALPLLTIVSGAAFCATFFSLYYQWKVVKAWCKMCLLTILVVWLQTLLLAAFYKDFQFPGALNAVPVFLLSFSLAAVWFIVKPLPENGKKQKTAEIDSLRWKRNADVFESLLYRGTKTDTAILSNPAVIGNKNAPVQLTIVSNPFCKPCSTAHETLHEIYRRNTQDVSLNVIFLVKNANDGKDRRVTAVREIVNALLTYGNTSDILDDWFTKMDINSFKGRYPNSQTNPNTDPILQSYQAWCGQNYIPYTPYIYINGHLIPPQYTLKDIESLIPEMVSRINPIA